MTGTNHEKDWAKVGPPSNSTIYSKLRGEKGARNWAKYGYMSSDFEAGEVYTLDADINLQVQGSIGSFSTLTLT